MKHKVWFPRCGDNDTPSVVRWMGDALFDNVLAVVDQLLGPIHEVWVLPEIERMAEAALIDLDRRAGEPGVDWAARLAAQTKSGPVRDEI